MTLSLELGSSHIKVYCETQGIIFYEPTLLVAKFKNNRPTLISFGKSAYDMSDKLNDDEQLVSPIRNGVITNFKCAKLLLDAVFETLIGNKNKRKAVELVFCVPSCATSVQVDEYIKLLNSCGISAITIRRQLTCIARLLDTTDSKPYLIVDIGAGKTEIGLTTTSKLIDAISLSLGGELIDLSLYEILKHTYNISTPNEEITKVKETIASLYATDATTTNVYAQNLEDNTWNNYVISSQDIYDALVICYDKIIEGIKVFISTLDDEHQKMVTNTGIFFSGLGCEIIGFEKYVQSKFNDINIYLLDTPATAVIEGAIN